MCPSQASTSGAFPFHLSHHCPYYAPDRGIFNLKKAPLKSFLFEIVLGAAFDLITFFLAPSSNLQCIARKEFGPKEVLKRMKSFPLGHGQCALNLVQQACSQTGVRAFDSHVLPRWRRSIPFAALSFICHFFQGALH